jgi:hypothetical protein
MVTYAGYDTVVKTYCCGGRGQGLLEPDGWTFEFLPSDFWINISFDIQGNY